jgi:hypothetical protein
MQISRYSVAMAVAVSVTLVVSALLVWLLVTEPVALATAVTTRDVGSLATALGKVLVAGIKELLRYL